MMYNSNIDQIWLWKNDTSLQQMKSEKTYDRFLRGEKVRPNEFSQEAALADGETRDW